MEQRKSGLTRRCAAEYAIEVVDALGKRPPETVRQRLVWLSADRSSYVAAFEFEDAINSWGLPHDLSSDERQAAEADLSEWRAASPYSDAEWQLLIGDLYGIIPYYARQRIGKTTIIEDDQERVTSGRELMQSWWKWRRGIDQFKDTNGVERGQEALYRFAGRLLGSSSPAPIEDSRG